MKMRISRQIAALLLCFMCLVSFTGCSDENQLVGTWELAAAAVDGESVNIDDVGFVEMRLNSDGTAKLITAEQTEESTWSYNSGKLVIDGINCTFDDDFISINDSGMYLKFEKR